MTQDLVHLVARLLDGSDHQVLQQAGIFRVERFGVDVVQHDLAAVQGFIRDNARAAQVAA